MVDGADKINSPLNGIYIHKNDMIPDTSDALKKPLPLISEKTNNSCYIDIRKKESLNFEIPEDAPPEAKDFIDYLSVNKDKLMSILDINSKTYDMLAQTAVAIADVETEFGTNFMEKLHKLIRKPYKWYDEKFGIEQRFNYSMGITNLKYTLHTNDKNFPEIKEQMLLAGIYNEEQLNDPEKSAMGTIILLANFNKRIDRLFLEGFEQSKEEFGTTRTDALCALWNGGRSRALLNGTFDPAEWIYTQKAHETLDKYKLIHE